MNASRRRDTVVVALVCSFAGAACADGDESDQSAVNTSTTDPTIPCGGVGGSSSETASHTHSMCVSEADFTPPSTEAHSYETSISNDHTHSVLLLPDQLQNLHAGITVIARTSENNGHYHVFALTKTTTVSPPNPIQITSQ